MNTASCIKTKQRSRRQTAAAKRAPHKQHRHRATVTQWITCTALATLMLSCGSSKLKHDATGTFEATEIIVSAEASGRIEVFDLKEGDILTENLQVGYIDSTQLHLKKMQLIAAQKAVTARRPDIALQIAATREQIEKARLEKARVENLFADSAAAQKQVDDAGSQLRVLEGMLEAQTNSLTTAVNSLDSESETFKIQIEQVNDQLNRCRIVNPVAGRVLGKYAQAKEFTATGKPLYRIADTRIMFLRAYVVAAQLNDVKVGQEATVSVSLAGSDSKSYPGRVAWIADEAEFTPKTVQTRDERQNLVYAVRIEVANTEGYIRIGTYGEVNFHP